MVLVLKRIVLAVIIAVCGLVFFAGCKSSPASSEIAVTPVHTNTAAPHVPPAPFNPAESIQPPLPLSSADTVGTNVLMWDAKMKKRDPNPGEEKVEFTFTLTNVSPAEVVIYATETTCDCTVAKLPM